MDTLVDALVAALTPAAYWASIAPFAPLIATLTIFAFSLLVVRRVVKGGGKGKARI